MSRFPMRSSFCSSNLGSVECEIELFPNWSSSSVVSARNTRPKSKFPRSVAMGSTEQKPVVKAETEFVTKTEDISDAVVDNNSDGAPLKGGLFSAKAEPKEEPTSDDKDTPGAESGQDAPRWMSSGVETYAIQCNTCFKWRIIPSKEKYEMLGEHILEHPFVCAKAQEWQPDITCDRPADLDENEPTVLWAIDKHNIPCPPKGFYRKVVLRAENAKKFADIYYKAPCGKTLRSNVQVQKYLDDHPEIKATVAQFSFTSPKGKAEGLGGVGAKRFLKDDSTPGSESRKRMKGSTLNSDRKDPLHGQPPRPRPLTGSGAPVKTEKLSAVKPSALKPKSAAKIPVMAVKKEKLERS